MSEIISYHKKSQILIFFFFHQLSKNTFLLHKAFTFNKHQQFINISTGLS